MKKRISIIIFIALLFIDGIISFFVKEPGNFLNISTITIAILSLLQFIILNKKASLLPTLLSIILFALVFILLPALTQGDVRYRFAAGIILYAVTGYICYNRRATPLHLMDTCILPAPVLCIMAIPVIVLHPDFVFIWMTLSPIIGMALAYVLSKVRQKILGFSLAIILVIAMIISYLTFIDNSHGAHYNPGDQNYTSLKFINESGDTLTLNDIHKKVIVLDFWYNGCFYCALGFPKVDALQYKYKNDTDIYIASMQYFINNNSDTFNGFFYWSQK